MSSILESLQFACGICRICVYTVFQSICGGKPRAAKPEFSVICIGLSNTGKSTLLNLLSGESFNELQPTSGFNIKALQFNDCVLNVKEIGGNDKVRPFWNKYYSKSEGVIFVVDSSVNNEELETTELELCKALENDNLRGLPCMILANCQDKEGAQSLDDLKAALELETHCKDRKWTIQGCNKSDVRAVKSAFEQYVKLLMDNESDATPPEQGMEKGDEDNEMNRI
ncbi:unnamed protein product [Owenia fusiformis]|uniref:ADP-ribosylation factor-like protein 15 n=1 Tax=Owenia fusiformis TaxID=6347 RepID=A0A8J1XV42_OWEFU|nr:unnamed protein product [Owenia fusiformis]